MGDADILGTLGHCAVEHLRRRTVGVFFEEVVLDFPDVVKAEAVGQLDLRQRLPVGIVFTAFMPRTRGFHFIQKTELHTSLLSSAGKRFPGFATIMTAIKTFLWKAHSRLLTFLSREIFSVRKLSYSTGKTFLRETKENYDSCRVYTQCRRKSRCHVIGILLSVSL